MNEVFSCAQQGQVTALKQTIIASNEAGSTPPERWTE